MLHDILEDFPGSQDGRHTEQFKAGTQVDLSDSLAAAVVSAGWARPSGASAQIENKAITTDGRQTGALATKRGKK